MICGKCNTQLPDGAHYCYRCQATYMYPNETQEQAMQLARQEYDQYQAYFQQQQLQQQQLQQQQEQMRIQQQQLMLQQQQLEQQRIAQEQALQAQQQALLAQQQQNNVIEAQVQPQSGIACPNCGSNNVKVELVEQGQMTTRKGVGFGGHMNNAARGLTAVATLGVSNLVWKKSEGTNKTNTITATMGICQSCGNTWIINDKDNGGNKKKFGRAKGSIFK